MQFCMVTSQCCNHKRETHMLYHQENTGHSHTQYLLMQNMHSLLYTPGRIMYRACKHHLCCLHIHSYIDQLGRFCTGCMFHLRLSHTAPCSNHWYTPLWCKGYTGWNLSPHLCKNWKGMTQYYMWLDSLYK